MPRGYIRPGQNPESHTNLYVDQIRRSSNTHDRPLTQPRELSLQPFARPATRIRNLPLDPAQEMTPVAILKDATKTITPSFTTSYPSRDANPPHAEILLQH